MASAPANVNVAVVGVGSAAAAVSTMRFVELFRPDLVILAGIAGAFRGSKRGLEVGQSVVVASEFNGDLGSFSSGNFEAKFAERLSCDLENSPFLHAFEGLQSVDSLCVNAAAAPFVDAAGFDIENMEGWGFFSACKALEVSFFELRTVSNFVGDRFEDWDLDLALTNLNNQLSSIISRL